MARGTSLPRARDLKQFGDSVRRWRKLLNLTAEMVAERAGITRDTLRAIEQGEGGPRLENVVAVLRVLDVMPKVLDAVEPMNSDRGILGADRLLPQRVSGARPRVRSQGGVNR